MSRINTVGAQPMGEPETRPSLMIRLRDPQDQEAWTRFVAIYEPLILRLLRKRGLQEADSRDVAQQVVVSVTRAVDQWEPDGEPASFRRWLFKIARNMALKFVERGKPARRGVGGSDMLKVLHEWPEPEHRTVAAFDDEYRNEIFHWAAAKARGEFQDRTWQAFWRTCVLHEPIADVAAELDMTMGNIYVARSRIIARLRRLVEDCEGEYDA